MKISMPDDPVFYYECSAGEFRLVYFLPVAHLKDLRRKKKISAQAVKDFPDGVDIGCTPSDFEDFRSSYGWSPPFDPDRACDAFRAVFSGTRRWKSFRGSGLIAAADLERHFKKVAGVVEPEDVDGLESMPATPARRRRRQSRQLRVQRALEKLKLPKVDVKKTLRQQRFSEIRWSKGESASDVFSRLHQRRS